MELTATENQRKTGRERVELAIAHEVPVQSGTIRVYHIPATQPSSNRPVVFVSGWGTGIDLFHDLYASLAAETEAYHVETREKPTSVLDPRSAEFTMDRFAMDLQEVITAFSLDARRPVLVGTCFGSAVITHALARRIVRADPAVLFDPMSRLWVPRWITRYLGPLLTAGTLQVMKAALRRLLLARMKEPVQRERDRWILDHAETWKWRTAAMAVDDWSIFHAAPLVTQPTFVVNGSHDRFHDSNVYPQIARALPRGCFVHVPVGEARREHLMGHAASLFSQTRDGTEVPSNYLRFVSN